MSASFLVAWRLEGRRALIVGGGALGRERARLTREAGASVVVVATRVAPGIEASAVHVRPFVDADLDDVDLVLVAIDDPLESTRIARLARARRIPVNVADQPADCDFYLPAVHRDGDVQLAVSTGGRAPAIAGRLRTLLAAHLPARIAAQVEAYGAWREQLRAREPDRAARARRLKALADELPLTPPSRGPRIRLVGGGPGDPELLTVAARRALAEADLVLADRLIPERVLALAGGEVRVADKRPGGDADEAQDALDRAGLEALRAGRDVVRLKIGDPFVFGRGGEEVAFYRSHGFEPEIVPGLCSALTAPLLAGIAPTLRGVADRVVIATGQGRAGSRPPLPRHEPGVTLVLLMAVARLPTLAAELGEAGWSPTTPAAIVERAGWADQRCVEGTVATLADLARRHEVRAPACVVIGEVVAALAVGRAARVA